MPGRKYSYGTGYRYGFNGKENDNEIKREGNNIDFGARVMDARLGRWFAVDKSSKPDASPYGYCLDSPTNFTDPDGNDEIHFYFVTQVRTVYNKPFYEAGINGSSGKYHPGFYSQVPTGKVTASYVIIKKSGLDEFYHHSVSFNKEENKAFDKTVRFFPGDPDSRSGLSSESFFFYTRDDRDFATLIKLTNGNSDLQKYFDGRIRDGGATDYDRQTYLDMNMERSFDNTCRFISHAG